MTPARYICTGCARPIVGRGMFHFERGIAYHIGCAPPAEQRAVPTTPERIALQRLLLLLGDHASPDVLAALAAYRVEARAAYGAALTPVLERLNFTLRQIQKELRA